MRGLRGRGAKCANPNKRQQFSTSKTRVSSPFIGVDGAACGGAMGTEKKMKPAVRMILPNAALTPSSKRLVLAAGGEALAPPGSGAPTVSEQRADSQKEHTTANQ